MSDQVPGRGVGWPELIGELLEHGPDHMATVDAALGAAAAATGAVGVQLVEWVRERPSSVRTQGTPVGLTRRPEPGRGAVLDRPVATARVDRHRDIVVTLAAGAPPCSPEQLASLHAITTLLGQAAVVGRKDAADTLHRLSLEIVGTLDLDRVLLTIANAAARLIVSEMAGVFLIEDQKASDSEPALRLHAVVGHRTVETVRLRIPAGRGIAGKALAGGRPARVDDYATTTEITKDYLDIALEEGTQSGLSAPMRDAAGRSIGVLSVWRRRPSVYTDEDEELLVSLAGLAAIGLGNARLYQQQTRATAAVEAARTELAHRLEASAEALDIHRRLTQIAAEGADLPALAEAVHGFVGGLVLIAPDGDRPAVQFPPANPGSGSLRPPGRDVRPARDLLPTPGIRHWTGPSPQWVKVDIEAAGVRHGLLYAKLPGPPSLRDVVTLEQSATICALLLGHQSSLEAATARLRSEFVWDLVEARRGGTDATADAGRAVALGLRLTYPARVVLVSAGGLDLLARTEHWTVQQHEHNRNWLLDRLGKALAELAGHVVPVAARDERLVAIVPAAAVSAAAVMAEALRGCSPFPAVVPRAGVSAGTHSADGLPNALHEARVALSAITETTGPAALFDDLGVLQFLLGPGGAPELHRYAERVLGKLVAYDAAHGTDLVATLDAYFDNDGNAARTARSLRLHAKSLTYRIQRIGEVGGLDLTDRQTRLDAELALRILGPAREIRARADLGTSGE
jgi:sugar diacid utilization regulator/putative methionine-R-sulfoxide reductase with GAF domain